MFKVIAFTEYEPKSLLDFPIRGSDLSAFDFISSNLIPDDKVFNISQTEICARHFVGVIRFKEFQIEILPKLLGRNHDREDKGSLLRNLIFMLSYTHKLDINDFEVGKMAEETGDFFEVFISIYAKRLVKLLDRNIPRSYVRTNDDISSIRGKIDFKSQFKNDLKNKSKISCIFDEFSEDNELTRLFKFVCVDLIKLTKNYETRKFLSRALNSLSYVRDQYFDFSIAKTIQLNKTNEAYIQVFNLALMFLQNRRTSFHNRSKDQIAILFNMNELFEEFILEVIRRNTSFLGIKNVQAQKGKRLVEYSEDIFPDRATTITKSLFNTFTDIKIDFLNNDSLIIDTKYKLIDESASHFNIKNADAYQVLTYKAIHSNQFKKTHTALLYPQNNSEINKAFRLNSESDQFFFALTVNLKDYLPTSMETFLMELKRKFDRILEYK